MKHPETTAAQRLNTLHHARLTRAFDQGQAAHRAGRPRAACPYPATRLPDRHNAWMDGWNYGMGDDMKDTIEKRRKDGKPNPVRKGYAAMCLRSKLLAAALGWNRRNLSTKQAWLLATVEPGYNCAPETLDALVSRGLVADMKRTEFGEAVLAELLPKMLADERMAV